MTNVYRGVDLDPYLNIAKIESFSKYCFAICDIRFLDIAFKDVIKDVTDSESKYFDFSKTLHRSPPNRHSIVRCFPSSFLNLIPLL